MRLFEKVSARLRKFMSPKTAPVDRQGWKGDKDRKVRVYRPADVANMLGEGQPFFHMASGGKYAIMVRRNRAGKEIPACFLRVDKDRRPKKERKRLLKTARALAKATT
jgi:hypothetical protein